MKRKNPAKIVSGSKAFFTPRQTWLLVGSSIVIFCAFWTLQLFPKQLQFSYAGPSCVWQLTLFPGLQTYYSSDFAFRTEGGVRVAGVSLLSTRLCAEPTVAPEQGSRLVAHGVFGGVFMPGFVRVVVDDPPLLNTADFVGRTVSSSLPLKVGISKDDTVHTYTLMVEEKSVPCSTHNKQLVCEVEKLKMEPQSQYTASIERTFKGDSPTTLLEGKIQTLAPLKLETSSIPNAGTVYDMRQEVSFSFDGAIKEADVILEKLQDGSPATRLKTELNYSGTKLTLRVVEPLDRKASFRITLQRVVSDVGSSLEIPVEYTFSTSGGPSPKSVSIGSTRVAQDATIVLSFDQPVKEGADVARFVSIKGANATVSRRSANEVALTLRAGPCQAFTVHVNKGLQSAVNNEVSEAWKFDSRTICGVSAVIGTSVQGRAIVAYYFGSGSDTILMTGGIHGSEPSSTTTMQALVSHYQSYGYEIPADKRLVIVPNTNPDGIAKGTRYNANNVNLGRNFPTKNWSASIETSSGTQPTGGGTSAGSEPEAAALIKLVRQLKPRVSISYHARGSLVGANKFADSVAIGDTYAKTVGYRTMYYNAEAVMGYPMTGEMEDWMGEELNIPAILIELPQHSGNYLNSQLSAIKKMLAI